MIPLKEKGGNCFLSNIIFEKSKKNLKLAFNRINDIGNIVRTAKDEPLFLAIGGYHRTYELLLKAGVKKDEIATFPNLNLNQNFVIETDRKKVLLIRKMNYVTRVLKMEDHSFKSLDLNVADAFEESLLIYQTAQRYVGTGDKKKNWKKPLLVVLDDPSLNLQADGYRFKYQNKIGFVQMRNRNTDPHEIIKELENIKEPECMMFASYQDTLNGEEEILNALSRIRESAKRLIENNWYFKPTELKKIVGSQKLFVELKEMSELGIKQLKSNKKIGKENARWLIVPDAAFEFNGRDFKDEDELFLEDLEKEELAEDKFSQEQERKINEILSIEIPLNVKQGVIGNKLQFNGNTSLSRFIEEIDAIESEAVSGIELLNGATTDEEYKQIKLKNLAYFLDGIFENDTRTDDAYRGGKRLISIDIDDGDYSRQEIEDKLEQSGFFGLVYPTAKFYYDQSARWRLILMSDLKMDKNDYKQVVTGISDILEIKIDEASKKISQLMGYPLRSSDVSIVCGTLVNVSQFRIKNEKNSNVLYFKPSSNKSLLEFDHKQAKLINEALSVGIGEGSRNETYRQIAMYLNDVLNNSEMAAWHKEASELIELTKTQAGVDGLSEKEIGQVYRA